MPGIKGMVAAAPRKNAVRTRIWQSMRIMRRFTCPDLCRASDAEMSNVSKFVQRLRVHGYVKPFGKYVSGRAGAYKGWTLCKDVGPVYPLRCDVCGRPLGEPCAKEAHNE